MAINPAISNDVCFVFFALQDVTLSLRFFKSSFKVGLAIFLKME